MDFIDFVCAKTGLDAEAIRNDSPEEIIAKVGLKKDPHSDGATISRSEINKRFDRIYLK